MLITVHRFISDSDTTISNVSVDGRFVCFGLEDEFRADKVKGETRIPAGHYNVGLHKAGRLHTQYSGRFAEFHRGMLHILDVPNFTHILIHVGNTDAHTDGCLLVGSNAVTEPGNMSVQGSETAYRLLYPMVIGAAEAGQLESDFVDGDR